MFTSLVSIIFILSFFAFGHAKNQFLACIKLILSMPEIDFMQWKKDKSVGLKYYLIRRKGLVHPVFWVSCR